MNRYLEISEKNCTDNIWAKYVYISHTNNYDGNISVFDVPITISDLMSKTLYLRHISSMCAVPDWPEKYPIIGQNKGMFDLLSGVGNA